MNFVKRRANMINKSANRTNSWQKLASPPLNCYKYGTPKWP